MARERGEREGSSDSVGFIMEDRQLGASTSLLLSSTETGEPADNLSRGQFGKPRPTPVPRPAEGGLTSRLVFTIAAAAFGSAFQHGYNTGVVNAPADLIEEWILEVKSNRTGGDEPVAQSTVTMIWATTVSMFCVGGMLGGSVVGTMADRFGRKKSLLLNNIFVAIAIIAEGFAKAASSYELLIAGRFFIGLNSGINAGLVPVYLAEVSPVNLRGAVGTVYQFVITVSILCSQILGMESLLGTADAWPYLFVLTGVPAVIQLIVLPCCPESPKHILKTTGNELQAKQALIWLRGSLDVRDEMDEMKAEYENDKTAARVTLRELTMNPSLRAPLIIAMMLMLAQQFSGINAAMYYSTKIFRDASLSESTAQWATLGVGAVNVAMTFVSLILVEKAGRKTLLLAGFIGMFFSTLILIVSLVNVDMVFLAYMSVLGMILFVLFFSVGPGSIPWFITSELFAVSARPAASGVAVVVNWMANFMVGLGFLPLASVMGPYVFVIFAALHVFFILFIYKKVPETKNRTTEEIAAMFRQASYE